jgi:hypothetical protein
VVAHKSPLCVRCYSSPHVEPYEASLGVRRQSVRGVVVFAALQMSRGASLAGLAPWVAGWAVLFAAITWYAWWYYGDSSKALALQTKAETKRTQRAGRSTATAQM